LIKKGNKQPHIPMNEFKMPSKSSMIEDKYPS